MAVSFWQLFVLAQMYHCTLAFELGIFFFFFLREDNIVSELLVAYLVVRRALSEPLFFLRTETFSAPAAAAPFEHTNACVS